MSENLDLNQFYAGVNTEQLMQDVRTPLPEGDYVVEVENMEIKDTKRGDGKYVKVHLNVIGPKHTGRKLWVNFNIVNPNPKAVEIGQRELYKFSVACGLPGPTKMPLYLGKRLSVVVVVSDDGNNNDIKKFTPLGKGAKPSAPKSTAVDAATQRQPSPSDLVEPDPVQEAADLAADESMPWG